MPYARYSAQDVEARGEQIYKRQVRAQVEPGNAGKFVVIDIETGQFEVDEDDLRATKRVLAKRPDAVFVRPPRWLSDGVHAGRTHCQGRAMITGRVANLDVYIATVVWHGREREVLVSQAAGAPFVGRSLLQGSRMTLDVVEGGDVAIEELREQA